MVRRAVLLFALLTVVYHSNLRPIAAGDSLPTSLIPFSLLLDGSVALDRFEPHLDQNVPYAATVLHRNGGHWYSNYPVAGPLMAAPLYIPVALLPPVRAMSPAALVALARILEKFTAVTFAAATGVLLWLLLRRLVSERAAWWLALLSALGTGSWSIASQAMWQQTFGSLAIVGCLYAVDRGGRWLWMAGVCAALAVSIRPSNIVMLPALAAALWSERAPLRQYVMAFLPPAAAGVIVALYNLSVFGTVAGGYAGMPRGNWFGGLAGLLISPGRGLLIYTPLALFAVVAFARPAQDTVRKHRPLAVMAGTFTVLHVAFFAAWYAWWGGYCWGPRLLTEVLPCLIVLIALGLPTVWRSRWRWVFCAAAVYGCLIQALGVYCYPKGHWDNTPASVDVEPARAWDWGDNPIFRTAAGGFVWEPYAIAADGVRGGPAAAAEKMRELGIAGF